MSQTLTLLRPKTPVTPQLHYSTSVVVPTVTSLATRLGLLDEEFASDFDLDVVLTRRNIPANGNLGRGDAYWIRDSELTPAMRNRAAGSDSRLVALSFLEVSSTVVALTTSGIRSIADLKGKRLGIITTRDGFRNLGYAQQLKVYMTTLSAGGLTLHDVRFVPFERDQPVPVPIRVREETIKTPLEIGKEIAERLERREFDAIAVDAASDVAHHASIRVLYDTLEHPDYLARAHPDALRGIVVSGQLLAERRDLVVRVLARLLQAADWARARPKQVAPALAENFAHNFDDLTGRYKNLSEGLQIDLGIEKILTLKAHKNLLLRHRLLTKDFDINPWLDHGPLVEAHMLHTDTKKVGR
jgi:sulfonate transport system substrate-binding protein